MDKEDYPSDSDQSDEDFRPENLSDSDIPSEEESDYKGSDTDDNEVENENKAGRKSRRNGKKSGKKSRTSKKANKFKLSKKNESKEEDESEKNLSLNEEDEKKRSDDLWASFLGDVNGGSTTNSESSKQKSIHKEKSDNSSDEDEFDKKYNSKKIEVEQNKEEKVKVTEILEFAGEEIEVTKEIDASEQIKVAQQSSLKPKFPNNLSKVPLKRPGGGLSSVLGQLGKKTKISVLEKSKLDWEGFKQKEGLKEELKTFNKGKDGFLERQDFLQRTDVRQFEIEKNLRKTQRKF